MTHDITPGKKPLTKSLGAFSVYPSVTFESQKDDEEVILLLRAHPITFIPWISASVAAFFLPLILDAILANFLGAGQIFFLTFFWYSALLTYVFLKIVFWLFNVGIVTNQRIIDIDYYNIIQKAENATSIEDVTDIGAKINGFIRSLFNYGDVFVQTAGPTQDIEFLAVPEPPEVVSIINELMKSS